MSTKYLKIVGSAKRQMVFSCHFLLTDEGQNVIIIKKTQENMMAKQKKNANYATEKTEKARLEKEEQKKKEKQLKLLKTIGFWSAAALIIIGAILLLLMAVGVFDYTSNATEHVTLTMSDGTQLHIELYGEDAPETVKHFVSLCNRGYFNGMSVLSLIDNRLAMGDVKADGYLTGITGEFSANGYDNPIEMKKGTLCLSRGNLYNSGYGQFFILTKDDPSIKGEYAAFGRVTDLIALERLLSKCSVDSEGIVTDAPTIKSISIHEAHH